jgi:uncharacterized protein with von Willebrand factor type A (vWA) domain
MNNLNFEKDFISLCDNEPLTLICGPLADFLWEDFARDSRPVVRYLADQFNLKQLSRFGKEVFDRLYNTDDVQWLVSLDAFEEYFRAVCNGDTATFPKGYKTENGMWWGIMSDLTNAPNWLHILNHAGGNQFAAGNCAVSILNQISDVIDEMIEESVIDIQAMNQMSSKLESLRQQVADALSSGDTEKAEKARSEARKIAEQFNEALQNVHNYVSVQTQQILENAQNDSEQIQDDLNTLAGNVDGEGSNVGKLSEKKELAKKLRNNRQLRQICKKLGALKQAWSQRKRAKQSKASYEAIVGAEFSNNVLKAFPTELALASTDAGRKLFALKYSQRTLLTKSYDAKRTDLDRGPICVYMDSSGSMSGDREIWAKAVALAIIEQAREDNREVQVHLFDNRIGLSQTFKPSQKCVDAIDFVLSWHLAGGTSFEAVLQHAMKSKINKAADVLMITDGFSNTNQSTRNQFKCFCDSTGTQMTTIVIGDGDASECRLFSDNVFAVNNLSMDATADSLVKAIR